jgi:hypothetical protein
MGAVRQGNNWGFVGDTGKEVVPPVYARVGVFYNGLTWAECHDGNAELLNNEGVVHHQLPPGLTIVPASVTVCNSYWYNDTRTWHNIPYHRRDYFIYSMYCTQQREILFGIKDLWGNEIVPLMYESIRGIYDNNLAVFVQNERRGVIDFDGNVIIEPRYWDIRGHAEGVALAFFHSHDARGTGVSAYDIYGNNIIPVGIVGNSLQYTHMAFSNGLLGVKKLLERSALPQSEWYFHFVNTLGLTVFSDLYNSVRSFSEGLAAVAVINEDQHHSILSSNTFTWAYIDGAGRQITEYIFDDAREFSEGMAAVAQYNENGVLMWGFINTLGEMVVPPQFNWAGSFYEGYAVVNRGAEVYIPDLRAPLHGTGTHPIGGQFMLIDRMGRVALDLSEYDAVGFRVSEGVLAVNKGRRLSSSLPDNPDRVVADEGFWGYIRLVI